MYFGESFGFADSWISRFLDFQISTFPDVHILGIQDLQISKLIASFLAESIAPARVLNSLLEASVGHWKVQGTWYYRESPINAGIMWGI